MVYRIDDKTAVRSLPALTDENTGAPGYFSDGNPATGEDATFIPAWWLNMIQEEVVGVVTGAGLSADKTNNGQLLAAIKAIAAKISLIPPFSATYAQSIGGYPAGATVAHPSIAGRFLICTQDGNENDPSQNMTGWVDPLASLISSPPISDTGYSIDKLGINRQTGQAWVHNANTGEFLFLQAAANYQLAGDYANSSDLTAETQRAEAAEASLLPLAGGTLTGTLAIAQAVGDTNLQLRPQNEMNGYMSIFRDNAYQQFGCAGGTIDQANVIMYRQDLTQYKKWSFDRPTGTLISPSSNVYPEIMGMSGRIVMQTFTYTKPANVGWTYVPFPTAFAPGTVPFVLPVNTTNPTAGSGSFFDAAYACIVQQGSRYLTTNQGFTFLPYGNSPKTSDHRSWMQIEYQFLAIGVMQ